MDEDGRPLVDEVGELVITEPMPSMPIYFWNDPDGERYRESYFEMFPGVWRHGDWIKITERGTAVIYGRSDSTINRGGVRMGTSEIYSAVEGVAEVLDSLVVDVEDQMILFVVLRDGLTDEAAGEIRRRRARALLAAARAGRDRPDRGGAAHALEQEARGAREEDPARSSDPRARPAATRSPTRGARLASRTSPGPAGAAALRRALAELGVERLDELAAELLGLGERASPRGGRRCRSTRDRREAARTPAA